MDSQWASVWSGVFPGPGEIDLQDQIEQLALGRRGNPVTSVGRLEKVLVFEAAVLLGHPDLASVTGRFEPQVYRTHVRLSRLTSIDSGKGSLGFSPDPGIGMLHEGLDRCAGS